MTDDEFNKFLAQAIDELAKKNGSLQATYGLTEWTDFLFDQVTASLQFKDDKGRVRVQASITPVGTLSARNNIWLWGWANQSLVPELRKKSERLQGLFALTGFDIFKNASFNANEEMAWEVGAMAVKYLGSLGCYRAPGETSHLLLSIDSISSIE